MYLSRGPKIGLVHSGVSQVRLELLKFPRNTDLMGHRSAKPVTFDAHPPAAIVALDFDSLSAALKFAQTISDLVGMFKIGSQLFSSAAPKPSNNCRPRQQHLPRFEVPI